MSTMSAQYRIVALPAENFSAYFEMDECQLAAAGGRLLTANEQPSFPCRVSLEDAKVGDTILAISYEHLPETSPYRAAGPIFVRRGAATAELGVGEIPAMLQHRLLSVRAYSDEHRMVRAEVTEGGQLESLLDSFFADETVVYVDIHNARPGCYNCRAVRV